MFQEKSEKLSNFEEEKVEAELSEQVIDKEIKENPEGFLNWFGNLKNSIGEWPKNFFENKAIKNAIIYASIPFAVLSATKQEIKAEDVVSEFVNIPTITQQVENKEETKGSGNYEIKADNLINVADKQQREVLSKRINQELSAFDKLSDSFNEAFTEDKNLIPKENLEKLAVKDGMVFDFAGRMKYKIDEANRFYNEISSIKDEDLIKEKRNKYVHKILEDAHLNFKELVKIIPDVIFGRAMTGYVHELAHEKEALDQGAKNVSIILDFPPRAVVGSSRELKNKAAFHSAGINTSKIYGEFLVNNLREKNAPSQFLAIMSLLAKADGMNYALATNFTPFKGFKYNDITQYAKQVDVSVSELTLGLTADFILDRDNRNLLNIALGKEGVKIPQTTIAPFYELGDKGPIAGIKFKGVF